MEAQVRKYIQKLHSENQEEVLCEAIQQLTAFGDVSWNYYLKYCRNRRRFQTT